MNRALLAPLLALALAGEPPGAYRSASVNYRPHMSRRELRYYARTCLTDDECEAIRASPPHRMEGESADAFLRRMDIRRAL
jgi:hypothetical protein